MKKNVGYADRALRIIAGAALIAWVLLASGPTWAWVGIIPLVTGLLSSCPAYSLLGVNSCKTK
ncbi:MAG: DUF2892 domain-containing protein [Methylophilaceae bacterium]